MAVLRLLISILIFIAATAVPLDKKDLKNSSRKTINYRLPDNVMPVHYNIKLIPYIEEGNFTVDGESSIILKIREKTQTLSLHTLDLIIDEAVTTLTNSDGNRYTPTNHTYNYITQILTLTFDNELSPENYTLNVKFVGELVEDLQGFYRTSYISEEGKTVWLATTNFEATWARRAFPCWDEPALKATFNISIKHNRNHTALSNMPIREQTDDGNEDGMIWTHFETTPVMSTYLVAFVVSDFVRVPNEDGTINMWCRSALAPHVNLAHEVAAKAGQLLTEYTNSTDKVPKMDHVAVPEFSAGAMENWGLIIYIENAFSYNEESDDVSQKHYVAKVVAHEMAHQWFGNVVSPLWWSEVWLNEGFASFFAYYILNQMFKDWRKMDDFVIDVQQNALQLDIDKNLKPITLDVNKPTEIVSLFELSSYGKAPSILRMLQHTLTEDVFREGIIKYLHAHEFSSATSNDLWRALQEALDESDVPHDNYKVKEVMDTWLKRRHYPVVHVTRNHKNGDVILTQEHFRPQNDTERIDDDKWWIPITFATQSNPDFSKTSPSHWLSPNDQNLTIKGVDPNDWIIVNLQQMGYYRVNYDLHNWQKISHYLNSDDYIKIHVLNRAQIINDAYHFMKANQLDFTMFLDLVKYFRQETDYIPWQFMFKIFEFTRNFYRFPQCSKFTAHIVDMLNKLVESVGYVEDSAESDITKKTRSLALTQACTYGHTECRRMANSILSEHLADPEAHKISPNLREWTLCNGMMEANVSTFNKFIEKYVNASDSLYVQYLTCCENSDTLINVLNTSITDNSTEVEYMIYRNIVAKSGGNDVILDFLLANWDKITSRGLTTTSILIDIVYSIYSIDQLDKLTDFVKNNLDPKVFEDIEFALEIRREYISVILAGLALCRVFTNCI